MPRRDLQGPPHRRPRHGRPHPLHRAARRGGLRPGAGPPRLRPWLPGGARPTRPPPGAAPGGGRRRHAPGRHAPAGPRRRHVRLRPHPPTFVAITFLTMMATLNALWYAPVGDEMEDRNAKLLETLSLATDKLTKADAIQVEYTEKIREAREKASAAVSDYRKDRSRRGSRRSSPPRRPRGRPRPPPSRPSWRPR
ncbi:unnamed protein product [Prorocentrum cordatum]|uniref:Uncharacterized protein n=1 Tax=Prorocentrum cordatum TaxID=2364126 RepID=A0ABN9VZU6_9DINO|nr:unnamed protein product [Polarella glacialis]